MGGLIVISFMLRYVFDAYLAYSKEHTQDQTTLAILEEKMSNLEKKDKK